MAMNPARNESRPRLSWLWRGWYFLLTAHPIWVALALVLTLALLVLLFAALYSSKQAIAQTACGGVAAFGESLYFSAITASTMSYGDYAPRMYSNPGPLLVVIQAFLSLAFLTVALAFVVERFLRPPTRVRFDKHVAVIVDATHGDVPDKEFRPCFQLRMANAGPADLYDVEVHVSYRSELARKYGRYSEYPMTCAEAHNMVWKSGIAQYVDCDLRTPLTKPQKKDVNVLDCLGDEDEIRVLVTGFNVELQRRIAATHLYSAKAVVCGTFRDLDLPGTKRRWDNWGKMDPTAESHPQNCTGCAREDNCSQKACRTPGHTSCT